MYLCGARNVDEVESNICCNVGEKMCADCTDAPHTADTFEGLKACNEKLDWMVKY